MMRKIRLFLRHEVGAAKTEAGFAIAALCVVAAVAVYLVMIGGPRERPPAPPSPAETALADLTAGEMRQFTDLQVSQRLDTYLSPTERTDAQIRNAHRTWAERARDPAYRDPDLAHDMFLIIDRAMQIRGVQPHPDL